MWHILHRPQCKVSGGGGGADVKHAKQCELECI
jgi:hypothetical protein